MYWCVGAEVCACTAALVVGGGELVEEILSVAGRIVTPYLQCGRLPPTGTCVCVCVRACVWVSVCVCVCVVGHHGFYSGVGLKVHVQGLMSHMMSVICAGVCWYPLMFVARLPFKAFNWKCT